MVGEIVDFFFNLVDGVFWENRCGVYFVGLVIDD